MKKYLIIALLSVASVSGIVPNTLNNAFAVGDK